MVKTFTRLDSDTHRHDWREGGDKETVGGGKCNIGWVCGVVRYSTRKVPPQLCKGGLLIANCLRANYRAVGGTS